MHHQFNCYGPALWRRVYGRGPLGCELHNGSVDGTPDGAHGHVLAHGTQAYVNVWPPAARGGNTDINANKAVRQERVMSSGLGITVSFFIKIKTLFSVAVLQPGRKSQQNPNTGVSVITLVTYTASQHWPCLASEHLQVHSIGTKGKNGAKLRNGTRLKYLFIGQLKPEQ